MIRELLDYHQIYLITRAGHFVQFWNRTKEIIKESSYYSKSNFGKKTGKKHFCRYRLLHSLRGSTLKALIVMEKTCI